MSWLRSTYRWCGPGVAPIWTLMKGKGYFDPCLTLISGQSSAKLKTVCKGRIQGFSLRRWALSSKH